MAACMHYIADNGYPLQFNIHNMRDKESKNAFQAHICSWCDTPMPLANQNENLVCSRCRQILFIAGISDDEIFRQDERN